MMEPAHHRLEPVRVELLEGLAAHDRPVGEHGRDVEGMSRVEQLLTDRREGERHLARRALRPAIGRVGIGSLLVRLLEQGEDRLQVFGGQLLARLGPRAPHPFPRILGVAHGAVARCRSALSPGMKK